MSWEDARKVQFHDVSAFFSEEEWKFLHEWQRELYRNVMKEVHQALISLGPLIATTVCSIRAKEKEEMWNAGNQNYESQYPGNHSAVFSVVNRDICLRKEEPSPVVTGHPAVEVKDRISDHNSGFSVVNSDISAMKEEPAPVVIHYPSVGMEASISHRNTGFSIVNSDICSTKEEPGAVVVSHPSVGMEASISHHNSGDSMINKKCNFVKRNGKERQCGALLEQDKLKMLLLSGQGEHHESRLWSTTHQELQGHENPQCDNGSNQLTHLHNETVKVQITEKHTNWDSKLQKCTKPFLKNDPVTGCKINSLDERPHQCMVCKKRFNKRGNLIVHTRTHTGEKPFQCSKCRKCFIQKAHLVSHERQHMGERPF